VDDPGTVLDRLQRTRADLVLADVALQGPNGYELCRAIKASDRPVPVVLLAGTFEPLDADRAAEVGADGHLVKPFESASLLGKVEALLEPPRQGAAPAEPAEPAAATPEPAEPGEKSPAPGADSTAADSDGDGPSPELVEAVARAVVAKLSEGVVREIAWQVVPELARTMIRERIQEIERED
jgi:CheY-like chemotaxis protein